MDFKTSLQRYYWLSKPGIIYGNLITTVAGYLLGSRWHVDLLTLLGLVFGLALTIAGACATNNYLDRGIDAKMKRTKKRSLVSGELSGVQALSYAAVATTAGLVILSLSVNGLTLALAAIAWVAYVALYGYAKRKTVHGTLIGCISGSIPLVAGYTAASGQLDLLAWQLFLLMTAWQMAHFYGIALYRLTDYKAAGIPVMPAVYGARATQLQALGYMILFASTAVWMGTTNSISWITAALLAALAAVWLFRSVTSLKALESSLWGRKAFLFSLIVMLSMSLSLVANPLLPL